MAGIKYRTAEDYTSLWLCSSKSQYCIKPKKLNQFITQMLIYLSTGTKTDMKTSGTEQRTQIRIHTAMPTSFLTKGAKNI
jgi:ribosomal protein S3